MHMSHLDAMVQGDCPLPEPKKAAPSPVEQKIGKIIADELVDDGATLQMGKHVHPHRFVSTPSQMGKHTPHRWVSTPPQMGKHTPTASAPHESTYTSSGHSLLARISVFLTSVIDGL